MVSLRGEFECGRKDGWNGDSGLAVVSCSTAGGGSARAAYSILRRCEDKGKGGKTRTQPVARWPCPGDTALQPLCCARIYIVKFSTYLQSRLRVHKTGDSEYPRAEWSRAGGPVASTYRAGRRACRVAARWVVSGHSRPNVHWHLTSSISPHILRCRPHGFI